MQFGQRLLAFDAPQLMGIVNVTPDSFSDGGLNDSPEAAVRHAVALVEAGAHILDIGGESTRPGAMVVDAATELQRVLPVIKRLVALQLPALLSVDTSKAVVAQAALEHGADIINDVSALADPQMAAVVSGTGAAVVLMHMRGNPRTMQSNPVYTDVVDTVGAALQQCLAQAIRAGIAAERILLDPGIGFGKSVQHNLELTRGLAKLSALGRPLVYGASRKAFLGTLTGRPPLERDYATVTVTLAALRAGAHVLRVHHVAAMRDALQIVAALDAL